MEDSTSPSTTNTSPTVWPTPAVPGEGIPGAAAISRTHSPPRRGPPNTQQKRKQTGTVPSRLPMLQLGTVPATCPALGPRTSRSPNRHPVQTRRPAAGNRGPVPKRR